MCLKLKLAREGAAIQKLHYNLKSRTGCPCDAYSVPTVYLSIKFNPYMYKNLECFEVTILKETI